MPAGPTLRDLPFEGSTTIRAYVRPRRIRVRSTDAADALGIPRTGNWAERVAREMRSRGWRGPFLTKWPDGRYLRGYELVENEKAPRLGA